MEAWTVERTQFAHWLFTWDGGSVEVFYIWLNGFLLDTVEGGEYDCAEPGYETEPPPLEIVDASTDAENELYSPYAILQWREISGAESYLIERYVSGSWADFKTLRDGGSGWFWIRTPVLEDETEEQFRVSALNEGGVEGTAVSFTFELTRNPSPPDVEYEIDSIGVLVVTEA